MKAEGTIGDFVIKDITQDRHCAHLVTRAAKLFGGRTTLVDAAGSRWSGIEPWSLLEILIPCYYT
jgi:hypothetical protein